MSYMVEEKEPAQMQTAAGYAELKSIDTNYVFSRTEIDVLRGLAEKTAEIAARPEMKKKAELWTAHNDLKTDEPLIFVDPENGWNEIITPGELSCSDPLARVWEMVLRKQIFWAEGMKDDRVIEPFFDVPYSCSDDGWGLDIKKTGGESGGAYIILPAIEAYEEDFPKLHYPNITIDKDESERVMDLALEVFAGILTVRRKHSWWWTLGMCFDYICLRGLEEFMCDIIAEPDYFHKMMEFLCEGKLRMLDFLEENDLLASNTGGTYIGSGGFGYTDQLPGPGSAGKAKTADMWGFVEAQETVSIDPRQYAEFILPYHKRIAERFGLNCYGCCEGYDTRWEYIKELPRLRRVSVSAWSDFSAVPDYLGKNYVASVKPSPAPLASKNMDEEFVRAECRRAAEQTKGGICEFLMKDNHTLGGNPGNITRWVEIMREEIARIY